MGCDLYLLYVYTMGNDFAYWFTGIFIFLSVYKPKTNLTPQQQVELQEELKKERLPYYKNTTSKRPLGSKKAFSWVTPFIDYLIIAEYPIQSNQG